MVRPERGAASNPWVPARSPGLGPLSLTRPPTGPIRRRKTNKGSYYTLLMKDTRDEGGQPGQHWNKRVLTLPPHPSPPPSLSHPLTSPEAATSTTRMPLSSWHCGGAWLEGLGGDCQRSGDLLIESAHWGSMWPNQRTQWWGAPRNSVCCLMSSPPIRPTRWWIWPRSNTVEVIMESRRRGSQTGHKVPISQ